MYVFHCSQRELLSNHGFENVSSVNLLQCTLLILDCWDLCEQWVFVGNPSLANDYCGNYYNAAISSHTSISSIDFPNRKKGRHSKFNRQISALHMGQKRLTLEHSVKVYFLKSLDYCPNLQHSE